MLFNRFCDKRIHHQYSRCCVASEPSEPEYVHVCFVAGQVVLSASWWSSTLPTLLVRSPGSTVCTWQRSRYVSTNTHTEANIHLKDYYVFFKQYDARH